VSNSQVTALIVRTGAGSSVSDYRINLRAKLAGSYWVRLARPCILDERTRGNLAKVSDLAGEMDASSWVVAVHEIRSIDPSIIEEQPYLF
jgi:hypothetical protein